MAASAKDLLGVPIIQAIINELISFASEEIKLFLGANDELKKLRRTLISIQAVLSVTGSSSSRRSSSSTDRETHSLVGESIVVGREHDKSRIIDWLRNNNPNNNNLQDICSVLCIVGFGGLGKTTLAQLVYNDNSLLTDLFEKKAWICVSPKSNKKDIFNKLLESIDGKRSEISNMDVMVNSLRERLGKSRYLIVLDDVWKDDENINLDDMLTILLSIAAKGSKIILTTRSDEVASIIGSKHTYHLGGLSEQECGCMLEEIAFGRGGTQRTPNLVKIGKEIANKCKGVPLVAKVLGGLMHSKPDEGAWLFIQINEIWNLPNGEKQIMFVLKLSYNCLPPYLKQCFSYCSLFPKDHDINKDILIQLWIAEGFLTPSRSERELLENIGTEYFNSLLRTSFL